VKKQRLFLIDATALCYRAFFAIKGLSTSYGQPTNAVFGFVTMLNKLLKEFSPDYLAICFDVGRETFRQKKFSEYKIQRPPMPNTLSSQIPLIKEIISAYNFPYFEQEDFEADDIIATLTEKFEDKNLEIIIISSDKDILQLVEKNISVFSPYKEKEGVIYTKEKILEKFGVTPERTVDLLALSGDPTDNIPGVKGIGEKTALELLREFGSLQDIIENLDRVSPQKIRKSIEENLEIIRLSRELVQLSKDIPLECDLETLKIQKPDHKKLFKIFKRLEFNSLLKDISRGIDDSESILRGIEKKFDIKEASYKIKEKKECILSFNSNKKILYLSSEPDEIHITESLDDVKYLLEDPNIKKIGYNLKDLKVNLSKVGINLEGLFFDVQIASYLLDPTKVSYSIEDLAFEYLDIFLGPQRVEIVELNLISKLKDLFEKMLKERTLDSLFFNIEMPLVDVLADLEINGVTINFGVLEEISKELDRNLRKCIEKIYEISRERFNLNSPKQLSYVLFTKLKLPVVKKTKTGISTDEEVLKKLARDHSLPHLILEYRLLAKLKSTYVDTFKELTDPLTKKIYTTFSQIATETGRLVSIKPNLQNIPIKTQTGQQIRRIFIPSRKEDFLLSADYSQIELRILAHLSKDENLISCFKKGLDVHKYTASLIYHKEMDQVTDQMRETAKRVNFGIIYGMSPFGLSRDLELSIEEATSFIEAYFLRYPRVKDYMREKIFEAEKQGFVTTLFGRKRFLSHINSKNETLRQFAQRQTINTPIQGTAADLIKLAMINIYRILKEKKLSSKMILQIHDELLFDVPEEELSLMIGLVKEHMENVIRLYVPIKVNIKIGKNWLEMNIVE